MSTSNANRKRHATEDLNNIDAKKPPIITLGMDEGVDRRVMAEFKVAYKKGLSHANIHENHSQPTRTRFYAFSQDPVTADEVFRIKIKPKNENGTFSIGFTSCNPDKLKPRQIPNQATDQSSINNQAIYVEHEAGYWKCFNYDISMGRRVLLKMKSNGEVLLMFGETDYRVMTVDNKEPIWWFVHSYGDVKFVEVLSTRCDYDYVEVERPQGRSGLAFGLPITSAGVLDRDFKHQAMAEFQQIDWESSDYLILYDNSPPVSQFVPKNGRFCMKGEPKVEFYGFSYENVKVDQIIEIVWGLAGSLSTYNIYELSANKLMTVGFTDRHPGSVDLYSLQVNKQGFLGRPDYWVFTNVDMTAASRVLMKIKIDGEVMMLVGDDDWRKLNVDMSVPLWLFFYVPGGILYLNCRNLSTVLQPENLKISPQRVSGLTPGVPVTANGEPSTEFQNQAMTEFVNLNWNHLEPLEELELNWCYGYSLSELPTCCHIFSKKTVQIEQVFEIRVHKTNLQNELHVGFTNRNPAGLDKWHFPDPAAAWSVDRADYWIFTKFDLTQGLRVLMKVQNSGEILVMFGEEHFRLLNVDFSEPLWLFVHTRDGIKHVTVRTYEKPLRNITGHVDGLPVKNGEQDVAKICKAQKEFRTMDYSVLKLLHMYECKSEIFQPETRPTAFRFRDLETEQKYYTDSVIPEYVFSLDCVQLNRCHRIIIEASKTQLLHVGFTSRDPAGLDIANIPNPAALGKRADYWIYTSFELQVGISRVHVKLLRGGEVIMWEGIKDFRVFKVDTTRPLWLFLNGKGVTMQCFYTIATVDDSESESEYTSDSDQDTSPPPTPNSKKKENLKECVICKDRNIDSVILNCGHVCCCYNCAVAERERSENCPICRQSITGVNMLYFC